MTTTTVTRHACARCGKRHPADRMIYSTFTRNRYCADIAGCDRRHKREKKDSE